LTPPVHTVTLTPVRTGTYVVFFLAYALAQTVIIFQDVSVMGDIVGFGGFKSFGLPARFTVECQLMVQNGEGKKAVRT
jgi:hypothetical protein